MRRLRDDFLCNLWIVCRKIVKVGMLVDGGFPNDQRAYRAASSLARNGFDVTVLTLQETALPEAQKMDGVEVRRVFSSAIFDVKRPSYLRSQARRWAAEGFNVLHCHDQWMLHLGVLIKRLRPESIVVYDSKELFHGWPLNLSADITCFTKLKSILVRRYLVWRERWNGRKVDHLITVNQSLAERLGAYFRLETEPIVIRNVPRLEICEVPNQLIRTRFGIPRDCKVLVFIGASIHGRTRNLEAVIDDVGDVEGMALVLISGDGSTKEEVVAHVHRRGYKNIFFHPWITSKDITRCLGSCDVGLLPTWNRRDLSYWLALDNKLFHYIMAELPVLATAQPEYKRLVERYSVGVCVDPDEPRAYLKGFRRIIDSYGTFKASVQRAKRLLNWEREESALLDLYRDLEERHRVCSRAETRQCKRQEA